MHKIIVMGDRDSIYGFSAGGFETCFVSETDDVPAQIKRLAQEEYAVIYLVERLYSKFSVQLQEYDEALAPAIIPIPGVTGNTGAGLQGVEKLVERAIGSDILFSSGS